MPSFEYDLAIIGAGSAGLTAARLARFFAKRVALIDKDRLGGDCLHYGCVPSKALIKASRVAHEAATAQRWGLPPQQGAVDLGMVNGRVRQAITEIGKLDDAEMLGELGVDVLLGGATFQDPHTLRAGDRDITAKFILIASGSRPSVPDIEGLAEVGYLTNEDVFDLGRLPGRLAVIGGGPIGVELAQALHRLGAHVTVLQRGPHLIPRDDADMIDVLERQFSSERIDVRPHTRASSVRRAGGELALSLRSPDGGGELRADAILCAVGREPAVDSLGLDAAGVTATKAGIGVNDLLQTNQPHIYAAGDVTGGPAFTHYAGHQAAHAVRNIFVPIKAAFSPGYLPWVTFTDPEIAHVGRTEAEVRATGGTCEIIRFPYSHNERAVTDAAPVGLMKFLIDGKRRLIGAHIAGQSAGEMINELTLAMNNDLTVDAIISSIHAYPTYSFAIPVALYDYALTNNPSTAARVGRFLSRLT